MALKTEQQIERDFYSFLNSSNLGKALKGKVYRDEMRPANAKTEDLVFKLLAGTDEQIQEGIVVCNIYVPDTMQKGGKSVKDHERIATLESLALQLLDNGTGSEYRLRTDSSMKSVQMEGMMQHCIVLRLKYRRITD